MVSPERFPDPALDTAQRSGEQQTVLAGGCFWCDEAVYAQLDGVRDVTNGYAGGTADTADYETVCSGRTGHAEVVRVRLDAATISFGQILKVFFSIARGPTEQDRPGNGVGRQYRPATFFTGHD